MIEMKILSVFHVIYYIILIIINNMEENRRCIYCDHKFIVDELDPEYKCRSCRKNNVTTLINTKW